MESKAVSGKRTARRLHLVARQIKYGGTPGCIACFGHARQHSPECRKRFEELTAKEPETVQAEGDARMNGAAAAVEQPVVTQGSAAPAVAQDMLTEISRAADSDVAMLALDSTNNMGSMAEQAQGNAAPSAAMIVLAPQDVPMEIGRADPDVALQDDNMAGQASGPPLQSGDPDMEFPRGALPRKTPSSS